MSILSKARSLAVFVFQQQISSCFRRQNYLAGWPRMAAGDCGERNVSGPRSILASWPRAIWWCISNTASEDSSGSGNCHVAQAFRLCGRRASRLSNQQTRCSRSPQIRYLCHSKKFSHSSLPTKPSSTSRWSKRIWSLVTSASEKKRRRSARSGTRSGCERRRMPWLPSSITPAKCFPSKQSARRIPATRLLPIRDGRRNSNIPFRFGKRQTK